MIGSSNKMAEHYTRNTLTATAWCTKCGRNTEHRIDNGRKGPCLEHVTPVRLKVAEAPKPQKGLFE